MAKKAAQAKQAKQASRVTISDIMVTDVFVLSPEDPLEAAAEVFLEHGICSAPVVDDRERVVGIISESDILDELRSHSKRLALIYPSLHDLGVKFQEITDFGQVEKAFEAIRGMLVGDVATTDVYTLGPDAGALEAARLLLEKRVNHIPVVKDGKLVGIVAREDIIKGLVKLAEC